MIHLFLKEVNGFLDSLIAYMVITVFLTGIGLLMWVFPETNVLDYGYADMSTLFSLGPYVFMFLIPAITMRMLAEEKKSGTMELLYTRPLTDLQIILGKYFAGFFLVIFSVIPTLIYYYSIYALGSPVGNIDSAGVIGSYVGLILLGGVFTSIGILASSLSENQIVSFILAVFLCFIFFSGFDSFSGLILSGSYSLEVAQLGIIYHYNAMSRGLIDSRDIIYFLGVITVMILLTHLVMSSRKW
ncbi:MAG: gliding motility-associated ABC transporter permease subunit GldF [Bacteroidetes bacterium]|nr:gliding motility-associated ABC transporter permease subunit GldF [Bacteroidota bacterium]